MFKIQIRICKQHSTRRPFWHFQCRFFWHSVPEMLRRVPRSKKLLNTFNFLLQYLTSIFSSHHGSDIQWGTFPQTIPVLSWPLSSLLFVNTPLYLIKFQKYHIEMECNTCECEELFIWNSQKVLYLTLLYYMKRNLLRSNSSISRTSYLVDSNIFL